MLKPQQIISASHVTTECLNLILRKNSPCPGGPQVDREPEQIDLIMTMIDDAVEAAQEPDDTGMPEIITLKTVTGD